MKPSITKQVESKEEHALIIKPVLMAQDNNALNVKLENEVLQDQDKNALVLVKPENNALTVEGKENLGVIRCMGSPQTCTNNLNLANCSNITINYMK